MRRVRRLVLGLIAALSLVAVVAWMLLIPIPIRNPFAHSVFLSALEQSNAKKGGAYLFTEQVDKSVLEPFFPSEATKSSSEALLLQAGFTCESLGKHNNLIPDDLEVMRCKKGMAFHLLYTIGWSVFFDVTPDGKIVNPSAHAYYDGP